MDTNKIIDRAIKESRIKPADNSALDELREMLSAHYRGTESLRKGNFENTETTEKRLLQNLLAVIHRDGGHYQSKHGLKQATEHAIDLILKERLDAQEIKWKYEGSSK